jgi:hypothetical protein
MQAYSDPRRESEPTALPDLDIWYHDGMGFSAMLDEDGEPLPVGWYWQSCFPGCLPDGEPNGPFETHEKALADARSLMDTDEE